MKREILFKAKRIDNNKWVQGYLFMHWDKSYIAWGAVNSRPLITEVIPETVGQYTGINDKHDNKIFEGDILQYKVYHRNGSHDNRKEVIINKGCVSPREMTEKDTRDNSVAYSISRSTFEVIGNVHENKELLKRYF